VEHLWKNVSSVNQEVMLSELGYRNFLVNADKPYKIPLQDNPQKGLALSDP
jgi:hypothetical protein